MILSWLDIMQDNACYGLKKFHRNAFARGMTSQMTDFRES